MPEIILRKIPNYIFVGVGRVVLCGNMDVKESISLSIGRSLFTRGLSRVIYFRPSIVLAIKNLLSLRVGGDGMKKSGEASYMAYLRAAIKELPSGFEPRT